MWGAHYQAYLSEGCSDRWAACRGWPQRQRRCRSRPGTGLTTRTLVSSVDSAAGARDKQLTRILLSVLGLKDVCSLSGGHGGDHWCRRLLRDDKGMEGDVEEHESRKGSLRDTAPSRRNSVRTGGAPRGESATLSAEVLQPNLRLFIPGLASPPVARSRPSVACCACGAPLQSRRPRPGSSCALVTSTKPRVGARRHLQGVTPCTRPTPDVSASRRAAFAKAEILGPLIRSLGHTSCSASFRCSLIA